MCFKVYVTLWVLCGFNTMPCVISWWSLNLVSIVFVTTKSNPGQYPFTLDGAFFPATYEEKMFLDCVWVWLLSIGPKDHMQKRSYLKRSLCCPWWERKILRVWVRLLSGAKSLHTREDNIMLVMNGWISWLVYVVVWYICDNLPYVRYYGFRNYIVGAHRF